MKKIFLSQQIVTNHRQCIPHINWNEILLCNYSYLDLLSLDVLDLFLDCNYLVRFYIYIYLNLNPTIEIVKASKHFLNATEWTNCFRRNYLFHIVVKSLTRILYRSMPSGDICSNEKWEKLQMPFSCIYCLGSLSLDAYILIWSTKLLTSVIYYDQS